MEDHPILSTRLTFKPIANRPSPVQWSAEGGDAGAGRDVGDSRFRKHNIICLMGRASPDGVKKSSNEAAWLWRAAVNSAE
jgi:hypothetical protein